MTVYKPFGFHPVDINDVINERYRIIHLLGTGAFAMVWLAEDLQAASEGRGPLVALKIAAAQSVKSEPNQLLPAESEKIQKEAEILRHIQSNRKRRNNAPGSKYVIELYDDFLLNGPNGLHQCFVMEFCGPSVGEALPLLRDGLPRAVKEKISLQLAEGVAFLQSCNVAHGDLHLGNLLICPTGVSKWGPKDIETIFPKPRKRGNTGNPGPPHGPKQDMFPMAHLVWTMNLLPLVENAESTFDISEFEIRITDFGESFIGEPLPLPKYMGIPPTLSAPEVLIRKCLVHAREDADFEDEDDDQDRADGNDESTRDDQRGSSPDTEPHQSEDGEPESGDESHEEDQDDYEHILKVLERPEAVQFASIGVRSDLWSLGVTLSGLFIDRRLFGGSTGIPGAEALLYEIGCTFKVNAFVEMIEPQKPEHFVPRDCPLEERLQKLQGRDEVLKPVIMGLVRVKPEERLDAAEAAKMIRQAWCPEPTLASRAWAVLTFRWLFNWLRAAWKRVMATRVVTRIRSSVSSTLGLHTGGISCAKGPRNGNDTAPQDSNQRIEGVDHGSSEGSKEESELVEQGGHVP